jgi:uncharacterized protein (DUF305 family)
VTPEKGPVFICHPPVIASWTLLDVRLYREAARTVAAHVRMTSGKRHALLRRLCVGLAVVALAGCSTGDDEPSATAAEPAPNIVQPGAPGQPSRTLSADELAALEPLPHGDADVAFMQGMIQHHAQALLMTSLVPTRTQSRDLPLLARRMELSQEGEIEQMRSWLQERGEEAPGVHTVHGHAHGPRVGELMPGMATKAELSRLRAARGERFDRSFLELMIRHHEGALTMVRQLELAGGGLEPNVDAFARHVEADQTLEIARMQELLASLG